MSRFKLQSYMTAVVAFSTFGCAEIGPAKGSIASTAGFLFFLVSAGLGIASFAVSEKERKSRLDATCGIVLFIALGLFLIG